MDIKKTLDRLIEIEHRIEQLKRLYAEVDLLTNELIKLKFKSALHNGKTIRLIDNFKDKNNCFRTTSIKRFEIRID